MNRNFDETLNELDAMLAYENDKKNNAVAAQKRAAQLHDEAVAAEKEAENAAIKLEQARIKVEEARDAMNGYQAVADSEPVRSAYEATGSTVGKNTTTIYETRDVEKTDKFGAGFVTGAVSLAAVAAILIGGWYLSKEAKNNNTRTVVDHTTTASLTDLTNAGEAATQGNETVTYDYNYDQNVVTVTTTTTTDLGVATVTTTDYPVYEELTQEKFEELCSSVMKKFKDLGIKVKSEDVVKFVAVFNIDKLKQDNPELVRTIIGTQTIEEVFADAEKVHDTLLNHEAEVMFADNNKQWKAYVKNGLKGQYCPDTSLIVSVADCVFDTEQQALIRSFEARRDAILAVDDRQERSDMVVELLGDLLRSDSEYRLLDDSTEYLILRQCVVPLDGYYCRNFMENKSSLKREARELITEFIAPVGSTEEEIQKSIMSGAKRNMMDSFKLCQSQGKTLVK